MTRLDGKSALVTGGANGIGRAIAAACAAEGARVAIGDIDMDAAREAAAAIGNGAWAVPLDVTDQAGIEAGVAAVAERAGRLDILVNNAAVFDLAPIAEITRASYERVFEVNVAGCDWGCPKKGFFAPCTLRTPDLVIKSTKISKVSRRGERRIM